jgi:hypothetical protein
MPGKVSMWCVICPRSEACFGTRLELLDPKWSRVCGVSKTCLGVFFFFFFFCCSRIDQQTCCCRLLETSMILLNGAQVASPVIFVAQTSPVSQAAPQLA